MTILSGIFSVSPAAISGPPGARLPTLSWPFDGADAADGGRYEISGTVKVAGAPDVPVIRRVDLFCARSKRLVRSTWSDAAGNYVFSRIRVGRWIVVSYDNTGEYNAVVADNIAAEPM